MDVMRVLVTGAHGLLGRSLLRQAGGEVELIACGRRAESPPERSVYRRVDLLDREEGMTPSWLGSAGVPSLEERELALQSAETTLETAQAAVGAARDARDAVAVLREVLWAGGAQALRRGVTACALALGFEVDESDDGNLVRRGEEVAIGSSGVAQQAPQEQEQAGGESPVFSASWQLRAFTHPEPPGSEQASELDHTHRDPEL